jgi:hypothetical protein
MCPANLVSVREGVFSTPQRLNGSVSEYTEGQMYNNMQSVNVTPSAKAACVRDLLAEYSGHPDNSNQRQRNE